VLSNPTAYTDLCSTRHVLYVHKVEPAIRCIQGRTKLRQSEGPLGANLCGVKTPEVLLHKGFQTGKKFFDSYPQFLHEPLKGSSSTVIRSFDTSP